MVITGMKPVLIIPRNMIKKSMQIDTRRHQNTKIRWNKGSTKPDDKMAIVRPHLIPGLRWPYW